MDQNLLLAILNGLGEAVFVLDGDRRILLANPAAQNLFGEGFVGRNIVRAVRHPECLAAINDVLGGSPSANGVIDMDAPLQGTYEFSVTNLGQGNADGWSVAISFNDITHIRHAEQMRSDFVANVSHELRSPLTALSGFIETLKGPAKGDEDAMERFLDLMENEAWRMNRLIGDLLSLSKVEADERVRPADEVDVESVIARVIDTLELQLKKENKTIRLQRSEAIVPVPGDRDQLTQVFQNLIENANKYGGPGTEILIQISRRDSVAGIKGPALTISVSDQGDGIDPIHIPRLTERFYRVDAGRSRDKGGTGLGLAIVKHIVNRHRGRLQIRSTPGEGSIFSVHLPVEP
ncbi:MAG: ATP-binding protein [Rhizobiaceae bacterium]